MSGPEHAYCGVITRSHLNWAFAMNRSLLEFEPGARVFFLVTDPGPFDDERFAGMPGTCFLSPDELADQQHLRALEAKYRRGSDEFRWSLKPVLMLHVLSAFERVLFCDIDLHFFSSPAFLADQLSQGGVLLFPHWRDPHAWRDRSAFIKNYEHGIFNSGMVGASRAGKEALVFWARNCLAICERNPAAGQYGDQTHLSLLPVLFDGILINKHRGCNIATWNLGFLPRVVLPDGRIGIAGGWPIVFVHFTGGTMSEILSGRDPLLMPHLERLAARLAEYDPAHDLIGRLKARIAERDRPKWGRRVLARVRRLLPGGLHRAAREV